jgi:hypothetical protein
MTLTFRNLPPIVTGYPLDDVWSVLVPVARTNLITNPSFETGTTAWTAIGGSIARATTYQYHGRRALRHRVADQRYDLRLQRQAARRRGAQI